jgi:uncharacterized protein YdeI (YjbR/CyaY-like superfamily)
MPDALAFTTRADLSDWLETHSDTAPELWVHIHKVGSGTASVTWEDCVIAALAVGWIDGIKKSLGKEAYLQRLTPRRKGSVWSQRNRDHATRLIAEGLMRPAGQREVDAAKADGRWDAAYAGPATMEIPADFLAALEDHPVAQTAFASLNRQNLYAIYHRLHTAKTRETRTRRMAKLIETLNRDERFH